MSIQKNRISIAIKLFLLVIAVSAGLMSYISNYNASTVSLHDFTPERITIDLMPIHFIDCSPDSEYVAFGSKIDNSITLWAKNKGETYGYQGIHVGNEYVYSLEREPYRITDIEFSPDSNYLLVSSSSHYSRSEGKSHLTVYNVSTKEVIRTHNAENTSMLEVAFSPDGKLYAASNRTDSELQQSTINLWDVETGELVRSIESDNWRTYSITFTPDGKYMVVSFSNSLTPSRIVFFDVDTGDVYKTIDSRLMSNLQFSPDGSFFVGRPHFLEAAIVWDTESGEIIHEFKELGDVLGSTSLSPDGKYLMTADDNMLTIIDLESKERVLNCKSYDSDYASDFGAATFSGDGKQIIVGLEKSDDSIYDNRINSDSGMIFVYNLTEILESYHE